MLLSAVAAAVAAPVVPHNGADCGKGVQCYPCSPLLSEAPGLSCSNSSQAHPGECTHDSKHRISSKTAATAEECCSECTKTHGCVAYTHWDGDKCNLFAAVSGVAPGNCTTGYAAAPPAPPTPPTPPPGPACTDCPNIVLMFTDDQDLVIGGWDGMEQTKRLIVAEGAEATTWTIHTPICAPSRSELLSGRYFHNIKNDVGTPPEKLCGSGAVGHVDLEQKVYPYTFAGYLRSQKGYHTGLFGKCMNGNCHNPPSMHGAFDRWFEGTNYQGGTWYDNESPGNKFTPGSYGGGYGTSVIGNKTLEWLRAINSTGRPFFVYFAPHAPHSPSTPASWYKDACVGTKSPRTPAFNYSSPLFHNLVARQPPLDAADVEAIDDLARKRCQSLLSVDDSYAAIHAAVAELGRLHNTYFLVSSDHGYNLGQHRLPSNKFLLYDHSLRIPMLFKGPGIAAGSKLDFPGTNVDVAPTILGLAGIDTPAVMDGKSVVPLLVTDADAAPGAVRRHLASASAPTRTYAFHEYYNQGPWEVSTRHPLDDWSNTYIGLSGAIAGYKRLKYGEYDAYGKQSNFTSVYLYELFDLDSDPYELVNIYANASADLKSTLHSAVRAAYECAGKECL
eukprot:TRINITY_DN35454_c0_g1_i1.p1 TRINITY_DN35454_c0_g1~~TRINITY_DN35454_c0_g1_i1.p1  ORF type:complete len:616 (+),score=241.61 TRINITY_DN35454_c0_g1_i1:79-1926(+)